MVVNFLLFIVCIALILVSLLKSTQEEMNHVAYPMKVLCYRVENTNKTIVILNALLRMFIKGLAPFVVITDV